MSGLSSAFPVPARATMGANVADSAGRVGTSFAYNRAVGTTPIQIVAPGANVNGLVLRTFFCLNAINGDQNPLLFADTAAPSGYTDTTRRAVSSAALGMNPAHNIFVPPGNGLWIVANAAGFFAGLTWDVL